MCVCPSTPLSMQCAVVASHIQGDVGIPVMRVPYVVAITLEPDTVMLSKKIRVLLIRRDVLANIHTLPPPELESERHTVRWDTLLKMAATHFPENHELIAEHRQRLLSSPSWISATSPWSSPPPAGLPMNLGKRAPRDQVTLGSLYRPKAHSADAGFMEVEVRVL